MTAVLTDIADLTAFEDDVARECDVNRCDTEAEWVAWFRHGWTICPQEGNLCTRHKDELIEMIRKAIREGHRACSKCGDGCMRGRLVEDFFRPYPLK